MLTGSTPDGRATVGGSADTTCGNWTRSGEGSAIVGAEGGNLPFAIHLDRRDPGVGVDHATTRRLTLHARSVHERDEYDQPVLGQTRTDTISFSSVGFTYGIRRARLGADVGWYERDSTAFGDTDSGIRYVLRLSFTP